VRSLSLALQEVASAGKETNHYNRWSIFIVFNLEFVKKHQVGLPIVNVKSLATFHEQKKRG
jgi:hypothetical protein